jgi:aristolochene synthase
MRLVMGLHLEPSEAVEMEPLEQNCAKHISIINDIYSWEKELKASKSGHLEGSSLCSGVLVLAQCSGLEISAAKRVLWAMTREWELVHDQMVAHQKDNGCSEAVSMYMKGLEYQMSGNELWSKTTLRYKM